MEQKTKGTALMVMDMQDGILGNFPDATSLLQKVSGAIAHARSKNIPVIYVTVGFRQGAPEISMNNKGFTAAKARFENLDMTAFMKVHNEVSPKAGELTVIKRRVSAFAGSDLDVVLRSFGIQHMILTGIATSGVVLSTLREAADKDYQLTVLADCCGDADEEVHRVLTTKVFARQADVLNLSEWMSI
jgi:nicotinamidase-related amidase